MGGKGSGKKPFEWTNDRKQAAIKAYGYGLNLNEVADIVGCCVDTLERFMKRDPEFKAGIEKERSNRKYHAFKHSFRTAFPTDKNGEWLKGDTSMGIFLLKTQFGLREAPTAKELGEAIAPLIQFSVKDPVKNAATEDATPGAYFDPQKETQEG